MDKQEALIELRRLAKEYLSLPREDRFTKEGIDLMGDMTLLVDREKLDDLSITKVLYEESLKMTCGDSLDSIGADIHLEETVDESGKVAFVAKLTKKNN